MPFPSEISQQSNVAFHSGSSLRSQAHAFHSAANSDNDIGPPSIAGVENGCFQSVAAHLQALLAKLSEEHEREVASLRLQIQYLQSEFKLGCREYIDTALAARPRARTPRGAIGKTTMGEVALPAESLDKVRSKSPSPLPVIYDSEEFSGEVDDQQSDEASHKPEQSEAVSGFAIQVPHTSEQASAHQSEQSSGALLFNPVELAPSIKSGDTKQSAEQQLSHASESIGEMFIPRDIWIVTDDMLRATRRKSWNDIGETMSLRSTMSLRRSTQGSLSGKIEGKSVEKVPPISQCKVLHPQSNWRIAWDIIGLVFVGYDLIMVPLQVFDLPEDEISFIVMGWLGAIFWTLDVPLNFVTGYYVHGLLEVRWCRVVRHYLRTWFLLDISIVVTEAVDIIVAGGATATSSVSVLRALRIVRCLRMIRLIRLLKLVKVEMVMQDLQARIHSNSLLLALGILKLILGLMLINHIIACIWYWIGKSSENGWTKRKDLELASGIYRYLTAVHWSLTQFQATMEIHPSNVAERTYGIVVVLVALILFSSFLSSITNMMRQLQTIHQERTQRQRVLQEYLKEHAISTQLTIKVRRFLDTDLDERNELEAQMGALRMLPPSLLMDVHDEAYGPRLAMHQFFVDLRGQNPRLVRQLCHESLTEYIAQVEDHVFATGDACSQMIWIHRGFLAYKLGRQKTAVASNSEKQLKKAISITDRDWETRFNVRADGWEELGKDRWLSEPVLWTQWEHAGDCKAVFTSNVLIMNALIFCKVIRRYENAHISSALYARRFVEMLNKTTNPSDLQPPPENYDITVLHAEAQLEAKAVKDYGERSMDVQSVASVGSRMSSRISLHSLRSGLS